MHKCGKREENMKNKTYHLILAFAVGFFSVPVPGQVEPPPPGEERLLISQLHPAFIGIDTLHIVVLRYGDSADKDIPFYKQLEKDVKEKLHLAGIELETPTADNILSIPELRIYVSTLSLEYSQQRVFHIRTVLARAVCLKDKQNPVFKANIWQATPVMQVVSAENMPVEVSDVVLEQVEGFINIYKATNPLGKQLSDVSINETDSSIVPEKQVDATEYKYVASKSSNIFHKPDCRWAKNISQRNLVTYKSKDEAIKAGKRPCKTCNP
jgi:hypothetical protein